MNIEHDHDDVAIVKSTIELGHNLGLKVVAEGIENKNTWNILKAMGWDYGQGYLMAKPMPANKLLEWAEQWSQKTVLATIED